MPSRTIYRCNKNVKIQKYIREESLAEYKNTVLNAIVELKNAITVFQNNVTSNNKQIQAILLLSQKEV
jgi:hypothetical protein